MASVNEVLISGKVAFISPIRKTTNSCVSSIIICHFSNRGASKTFVPIIMWGHMAEKYTPLLQKGTSVSIMGRLASSSWVDSATGKRKNKLEVVANKIFIEEGNTNDLEPEPPETAEGGTAPF